jgi:hypothetical protein
MGRGWAILEGGNRGDVLMKSAAAMGLTLTNPDEVTRWTFEFKRNFYPITSKPYRAL